MSIIQEKEFWNMRRKVLGSQSVQILQSQSNLSVAMVETEYKGYQNSGYKLKQGKSCPWVRIGNLYVATLETNCHGWKYLLEQLYSGGAKKFAVFTGRHGSIDGTLVKKNSTLAKGHQDSKHKTEDSDTSQELRKSHSKDKQFELKLVDVGLDNSTMDQTRFLAKQHLTSGRTVLFAWCYSLLSMYEWNANDTYSYKSDTEGFRNYCGNKHRKVSQIVGEVYGWVPRN